MDDFGAQLYYLLTLLPGTMAAFPWFFFYFLLFDAISCVGVGLALRFALWKRVNTVVYRFVSSLVLFSVLRTLYLSDLLKAKT